MIDEKESLPDKNQIPPPLLQSPKTFDGVSCPWYKSVHLFTQNAPPVGYSLCSRYRRHRRTSGPFLPRAHSGTHKTCNVNLVRTVVHRYRHHPGRTGGVGLGKDAEAKLQKRSKGNRKMNHGDLKRMKWEGEEKELQDEYRRGVRRAWRKAGPPP